MSFREIFFEKNLFPSGRDVPFGKLLYDLFFLPMEDNQDFPIHGPNVIRLSAELLNPFHAVDSGLFAGTPTERHETARWYNNFSPIIQNNLEIESSDAATIEKTQAFLAVAALYHDIGKTIRRANHPQIGANLLRNFDMRESKKLVDALTYDTEPTDAPAKHNRFSLITSITQHHDKFGVVSTGEGSLPLFSDILYFTSDKNALGGIRKNVTSVMLLNVADIAAVNTAPSDVSRRSLEIARAIATIRRDIHEHDERLERESEYLDELSQICCSPTNCLGLLPRKVRDLLEDWKILIETIGEETVEGNRTRLKRRLLELERNPARAILRIRRLLIESAETSRAGPLLPVFSPTAVESVLVGTLGSHQFQTFCEQLATIVKLDYGLNLFKALMCAVVRKSLDPGSVKTAADWKKLSTAEEELLESLDEKTLQDIAIKVTVLFVKVLAGLVSRYGGVLGHPLGDPRRFGFQLRDLTGDSRIRDTIIDLLCVQESKDFVALTWMADEVFVWSMD